MPELPEVETIRLGLQKYLVGHTIEGVEVRLPKMIQGDIQHIIGSTVIHVERYGKGLVIILSSNYCLAIHIKLTGQLIYQDAKHSKHEVKIIKNSYGLLPHKWTHVIFKLKSPAVAKAMAGRQNSKVKSDANLYYNDFRQFGWIKILPYSDLHKVVFFKELGPEFPLPQITQHSKMTLEEFKKLISASKTIIKPLLLEQQKISGLGNIYVNEGLYDAKINPKRKASTLTDEEIETVYYSLQKVLKIGLESGGASELSYVNVLGQEGGYQKYLQVYGRQGKPCKRCGITIQRISLGGRGTFFCPNCQK